MVTQSTKCSLSRDIVQRSETLEVGIQHKTLLTAGSVERPLIPILVRTSE